MKAQQDFFVYLLVGFAEGVEHNLARRLAGGATFHTPKDLLGDAPPNEPTSGG